MQWFAVLRPFFSQSSNFSKLLYGQSARHEVFILSHAGQIGAFNFEQYCRPPYFINGIERNILHFS
jgi:hypothetical protein